LTDIVKYDYHQLFQRMSISLKFYSKKLYASVLQILNQVLLIGL